MAKVFGFPNEITFPEFQWKDQNKYEKDVQEAKDKLKVFCKENSKCPDAGKIISFQIADGYAQYMIFKYSEIIHIPEGDAYQIHDATARGLRKADIVNMLKAEKLMDSLFTPKIALAQ